MRRINRRYTEGQQSLYGRSTEGQRKVNGVYTEDQRKVNGGYTEDQQTLSNKITLMLWDVYTQTRPLFESGKSKVGLKVEIRKLRWSISERWRPDTYIAESRLMHFYQVFFG